MDALTPIPNTDRARSVIGAAMSLIASWDRNERIPDTLYSDLDLLDKMLAEYRSAKKRANHPTPISMKTAGRIWEAHREIEVAKKLRDHITEALAKGDDPTPIDHWGRHRNCQLGIPSGDSSHQLFDVDPKLAVHIIDAHIANKQKDLVEASIAARIELEGGE